MKRHATRPKPKHKKLSATEVAALPINEGTSERMAYGEGWVLDVWTLYDGTNFVIFSIRDESGESHVEFWQAQK